MFEDRTKNYDFNKIDSAVRTKVITENTEKSASMTDAQKKLFTAKQPIKESQPILTPHKSVSLNDLPSSKYLQSFSNNLTVGEAEEQLQSQIYETPKEKTQLVEDSTIDFDKMIEEASEIKLDSKPIKKEIEKISQSPKKNYSFRIKLVAGVYCILVALFGGWVIGNAIDISHTNANIYETISETKEIESNIASIKDIVLKIKNLDDGSKNPEDDSLIKEMITKTIETTPEATTEPNEYTIESNWFDVFCNWLSKIFGG